MKQICFGAIAWMALATIVVFIPHISPWIATPMVLIGIIFVLGFLWAINLKINSEKIAEFILYAIGLGLGYIILGGLIINWILPYLGVTQPLAPLPLAIFFDASALILCAGIFYFQKEYILPWKPTAPNKISLWFGIAPILFVVASVWGAEILNNGGSGTLTLIMLFAIALYGVMLTLNRHSVQGWTYISALYFISLSLLLMYSLRSAHILGWDINQEYEVFQMTLQSLRWKMSYYPGLDYNACLSITILPTILKELTNISSEYVFKVTFQLLFAVVPVMVYVFAKRYLKSALAFLAAFLLISQTWFFEQMPGLIRQEISFIFYAALLLVLFDKKLSTRARYILFYLFTIGLVLSHYSTAYVWLALMLVVVILSYIARIFIKSLRTKPMVIKPLMLVLSLLIVFIWQVPLTHTAENITNFVTDYNKAIPALSKPVNNNGKPTATTKSVVATAIAQSSATSATTSTTHSSVVDVVQSAVMEAFFAGGNANTNQNLLADETSQARLFGASAGYEVYANTTTLNYVPTAINESINVNSKLPSWLSALINFLAWISKLLLIDIFPIIGIVGLYFISRRRLAEESYDFIILNIGAYGLVVIMILVPYAQEYYNFTRLYLQMFLSLSTIAIVGGVVITKYLPKYKTITLTLMVAILFCSLSGAFDQLTGGQARFTLDQPPSTLDTYDIHDAEIASARWLMQNRQNGDPVQADDVAALRLQSFANINESNDAIFPQTIERNSYVYLIGENIARGTAFSLYNNNLLNYNYPLAFLDTHKNLIYNGGGSRVYR